MNLFPNVLVRTCTQQQLKHSNSYKLVIKEHAKNVQVR